MAVVPRRMARLDGAQRKEQRPRLDALVEVLRLHCFGRLSYAVHAYIGFSAGSGRSSCGRDAGMFLASVSGLGWDVPIDRAL